MFEALHQVLVLEVCVFGNLTRRNRTKLDQEAISHALEAEQLMVMVRQQCDATCDPDSPDVRDLPKQPRI